MKRRLAIALAMVCIGASAQIADPPTLAISVHVEVIDEAKICDKAVTVLVERDKITAQQARDFMTRDVEITPRTTTCLEVIFTDLGSPANGYQVHEVSAYPGILR